MKGQELYANWAPAQCVWSRWAKPVLFAEMGPDIPVPADAPEPRSLAVGWAPGPEERVGLVLDVPGPESAALGAALALQRGYCPVPLFNASSGPDPVIDLWSLKMRLAHYAAALPQARIPHDAPPVFLLDSRRAGAERFPVPGRFDNRWVVFPQDFPSANLLLGEGLRALWLVQSRPDKPADDLLHVLRRWQEGRVPLFGCDPYAGAGPEPLPVRAPSRFRAVWYRALVMAGLRRSGAGGFGAPVPMPSSSGGYG